jgi:hypothetical protein
MTRSDHPEASNPLTAPALWQQVIEWGVVVPIEIVIFHFIPHITGGAISWWMAVALGCGSFGLYSLLRATVAKRLRFPNTAWGHAARIFSIALLGAGVGAIVNVIVPSPGLQMSLMLALVIGMVGGLQTHPSRRC